MKTNPITLRNDAILNSRRWLDDPDSVIILDTETTGVGELAEAVQVSAINCAGDVLINEYLMPVGEIHPLASKAHGLTKSKLKKLSAKTWDSIYGDLESVITGKDFLAYNASYDLMILEQSSMLYGLPSIDIEHSFCVMREWQKFNLSGKPEKLNGNHNALGDCLATLELIKKMAEADLQEDPTVSKITGQSDLFEAYQHYEDLSKQIKVLSAQKEAIKFKVLNFLEESNLEAFPCGGGGKQVKRYLMASQVKPTVQIEDLESKYPALVQKSIDRKAAKLLTNNWTQRFDGISYEVGYSSIRFLNL